MINEKMALKYCAEDISLIENYEIAIADEKCWVIHHRLETHKYKDRSSKEWIRRDEDIPRTELIALGLYHNRPAAEFIFMTKTEHQRLHMKNNKRLHQKISKGMLGHKVSDETKQKMSKAKKNKYSGRPMSEETKRKISEAHKGKIGYWAGKHWKLVDGKRVIVEK